ncbi:MAG: hypothetical protein HY711_07500 [Candidatus Melainabacteria bacterium]|nr:hypothetical protein [Candidatus Melainabacteria bacterium]
MNKQQHTTSKTSNKPGAVALVLFLFIGQVSVGQSVYAQALSQGTSTGLYPVATFQGEDTLLPPEVVPLEPLAASRMSQAQAQSRASGYGEAVAQGNLASGDPLSALQSAQDFRKAALNSLMGQGQLPGQMATANQGQTTMPYNTSQLGSSPLITSNTNSDVQLGQSSWMQPGQNPSAAQSSQVSHGQMQTLSGGVKQKQVHRDIRRSGLSNALSALGGFGSGVMVGSMVRNPNTAFGLGMFGLGLTGFGVRNAFRF